MFDWLFKDQSASCRQEVLAFRLIDNSVRLIRWLPVLNGFIIHSLGRQSIICKLIDNLFAC